MDPYVKTPISSIHTFRYTYVYTIINGKRYYWRHPGDYRQRLWVNTFNPNDAHGWVPEIDYCRLFEGEPVPDVRDNKAVSKQLHNHPCRNHIGWLWYEGTVCRTHLIIPKRRNVSNDLL